MDKKQIEEAIVELKDEYIQLQNNLEKLESIKGNLAPLEKRLNEIEDEMKVLHEKRKEL
ncbi:SE1832 family protein [Evansella sp. AB-rgal1]|uniref:SE1832 family protein n=1 Tax=Evansella sp. AB-rgal1 TaxID=3242696 RepID=UPI00359D8401